MAFKIEFSNASDRDMQELRVFDQRRVGEAVLEQLTHRPNVETRNIKCLGWHITADFDFIPPLWELRVGNFRVFYEVDEDENVVYVNAVRYKPPGATTAEVLHEANDN